MGSVSSNVVDNVLEQISFVVLSGLTVEDVTVCEYTGVPLEWLSRLYRKNV